MLIIPVKFRRQRASSPFPRPFDTPFHALGARSYDWRMAPERELFLIDGNSLAYRAYYALPDSIATSRGEPTNAIFGFASMLVKILTDYGPKATIVVWDA